MIVERITEPEQVVTNWKFFDEGLRVIKAYAGESLEEAAYCKLLTELSTRHDSAWIGLVKHGGWPLGYGVAVDSTLPFAERRTFTVVSFYHMQGQFEATTALMRDFEKWAIANGVDSYVVTTRRNSGPAIRCFSSERYGFKKSYRAFEKHLS